MDNGDFIIVVNADQVILTGRKEDQKVYYRHSGRPGSLKSETARRLRQPKNRLGRQLFRKLKVYAGPDHPHQAQQPEVLELTGARRTS